MSPSPVIFVQTMCGGVLTLTSGSTMRGWFSPDLHTLWLGELTKWSQVNPAVRDSMDLMGLTILHVAGRVTGPGAVEEGEAGGESLHRQPVRRVGDM